MTSSEFNYTLLSYDEINKHTLDLAAKYPRYAISYTAQERYGLPSPGECGKELCEQRVLHITDHESYHRDLERPEVFFSGALHGNERVGPTVTVELAELLLKAVECHRGGDGFKNEACKHPGLEKHLELVSWLSWLVHNRSIVLIPLANAKGYYDNVRRELDLDPNRDFPFHNFPDKCMKTIAARVVNEVWREYIFQIAVTFHGGTESISYEWGDMEHPDPNDTCPDDYVLNVVGLQMKEYAGGAPEKQIVNYDVNIMNSIVYPVRGGMEDWGYAGSWDKSGGQVSCSPDTFGGYNLSKTIYEDPTLRACNYLVETSNLKTHLQETLGKADRVLDTSDPPGNGHITRNVRLALLLTDIVEPYVVWSSEDDDHHLEVLQGENSTYSWEVGGALTIDASWLLVGPWSSNVSDSSKADLDDFMEWANFSTVNQRARIYPPQKASFQEKLVLTTPGKYFVLPVAVVDQGWLTQPDGAQPRKPPQSHLVNARTNTSWDKQLLSGRRVKGNVQWFGPVRLVQVGQQHSDNIRTFQKGDIAIIALVVLLSLLCISAIVKKNWGKFRGGRTGNRVPNDLSPMLEMPHITNSHRESTVGQRGLQNLSGRIFQLQQYEVINDANTVSSQSAPDIGLP